MNFLEKVLDGLSATEKKEEPIRENKKEIPPVQEVILKSVEGNWSELKELDVDIKTQMLVFTMNGKKYAFYGEYIKEILISTKIFPVPGTSDFIAGVINVRGSIESVILLNRILGLPNNTGYSESKILLAEYNEYRFGLLVETVNEVLDFSKVSIRNSPKVLNTKIFQFVSDEFTLQGELVFVLDIGKILESTIQ